MALQIIGAGPDPEEVAGQIKASIEREIPGATVEVGIGSAGHYEVRVVSDTFEGRSRVQQQQSVYKAITHLMQGKNPAVHAIDRMECIVP
ncbi:MAG: BolA/IbaG family iron-sulfur metabolism protein [Myxococcota bacterium]